MLTKKCTSEVSEIFERLVLGSDRARRRLGSVKQKRQKVIKRTSEVSEARAVSVREC